MSRENAAPPHVARQLLELRCDCGQPATTIHLLHPDDAARSPRPAAAPRRSWPQGLQAFARPACGMHTHGGYAIDLQTLLAEWDERLDALARRGIDADAAVRGLIKRAMSEGAEQAPSGSSRESSRRSDA